MFLTLKTEEKYLLFSFLKIKKNKKLENKKQNKYQTFIALCPSIRPRVLQLNY